MAEYNLEETRYTDILEADIQHAVSSIKGNHPNPSEVMLQGHLKAWCSAQQNKQGYTWLRSFCNNTEVASNSAMCLLSPLSQLFVAPRR